MDSTVSQIQVDFQNNSLLGHKNWPSEVQVDFEN